MQQSNPTKWLIHSYEGCGAAEVKRPMPEMLREGLNHLDRIPFSPDGSRLPAAAWAGHIVSHYDRLPTLLVFVPAGVDKKSTLFWATGISTARATAPDFGAYSSGLSTVMPADLQSSFCASLWPLIKQARDFDRPCPERVVGLGDADSAYYATAARIKAVPLDVWKQLQALLNDKTTALATAKGLSYSWHILFGEKTMLKPPLVHFHFPREDRK